MAYSTGSHRSESGAQLLARLSTRPDIKGVDPFIFDRTSPSCQIIELYGMEGTGKSELALQCSARVCLPSSWNGVLLSGLQAKVIYIDTDSKFSILRLAVILEKQILQMLKSNSECKSKLSKNAAVTDDPKVNFGNVHHTQVFPREDNSQHTVKEIKSQVSLPNGETETHIKEQHCMNTPRNISEDCNARWKSSSIQTKDASHNVGGEYEQMHSAVDENISSGSNQDTFHVFSPEELEQIVQDSLCRIQILRPSNSQQLLSSLLSLENVLMEDTLCTLIVIDSISAFYWLDRLASPNNYQHLDSRMVPIAKTLKKYASEFGVTCLITKAAFFMGKKRPDQEQTTVLNGNSSKMDKISEPYTYNEYLGKIWSSINVNRFMLTSMSDVLKTGEAKAEAKSAAEVKKIRAYSVLSETVKQYFFTDDLLIPEMCS